MAISFRVGVQTLHNLYQVIDIRSISFSGFYIYKEMQTRLNQSGYYGIPKNMDYDGINLLGQLCATTDRALEHVHGCTPMKKIYYLQYQYMPFFVAALSLLYYFPYIIYKLINTDLFSLKEHFSKGDITSDIITQSFFNHGINTQRRMRYRSVINISIKLMYLLANIIAFCSIDKLLNNDFSSYGIRYTKWMEIENYLAHSHNLKMRVQPKPGNVLLPPMGFCDIHEATRDVRNTHINTHKFICEISGHILYQYVMLLFWFLLVIGIVLSSFGLLIHLFSYFISVVQLKKHDDSHHLYKILTLREIDYLDYIRQRSTPLYHGVAKSLKEARYYHQEQDKLCNGVKKELAVYG